MKKRTVMVAIAMVVLCCLLCAGLTAKRGDCEKKIQTFMAGLVNGKVDKSCDDFFSGSQLASRPEVVKLLKDKMREAFTEFGKAQSYESIKEQKYGDSIIRFVYILKCQHIPLIWEFYFYKAVSDWELITVSANLKGQYDLLADK